MKAVEDKKAGDNPLVQLAILWERREVRKAVAANHAALCEVKGRSQPLSFPSLPPPSPSLPTENVRDSKQESLQQSASESVSHACLGNSHRRTKAPVARGGQLGLQRTLLPS